MCHERSKMKEPTCGIRKAHSKNVTTSSVSYTLLYSYNLFGIIIHCSVSTCLRLCLHPCTCTLLATCCYEHMGSKIVGSFNYGGSLNVPILLSVVLVAFLYVVADFGGYPISRVLHTRFAAQNKFYGPRWRTHQTLATEVLYDGKWQQLERHTILAENNKTIKDWIWNNYKDQVNILVEKEGQYLVFRL